MNKILISGIIGISVLAVFMFSAETKIVQNNQTESNESQNKAKQTIIKDIGQSIRDQDNTQQSLSSHKDDEEAGFNFTPYITKEMADEIRPYTSRSNDGLEVKTDSNGNEYVDLKKRWSHATISVVDENGVKHTGEWAPDK